MDLWVREARLFKYRYQVLVSNSLLFVELNEPLSGGEDKSSGLSEFP